MAIRKKIVTYCEDFLKVKNFQDYCVNGLQVEGKVDVKKIITGVSLSVKLIESAIAKKADMIIVHHGIFRDQLGAPPAIKGYMKKRIKMLMDHDINLCGFHLPLDAHPEIGNNISLLKLLGLKKKGVINFPGEGDLGFIGKFDKQMKFGDFVRLVDKKLGTRSYAMNAGGPFVKVVGIVSGAASPDFEKVSELGADTYLTGDLREEVVRPLEEVRMNFINAGHYNTEKMGVINLGNLLVKKFGLKVEYVDIPCDV